MDSYLLLVGAAALGGIVAIFYAWHLLRRSTPKADELVATQAANPPHSDL